MSTRRVFGAGLSLAVHEQGDPGLPTIVLLHGYPDTSAVWDPVVARLAHRYHTVTYDVRGAGASDAPRGVDGYRLELLLGDLAAVLAATSPDRAVHLVGHDWGSLQGWEAVSSPLLRGRIASYTSMSGPSLDHVAAWTRRRLAHPTRRGILQLAGQALRSCYIAVFHLPGLGWVLERSRRHLSPLRSWWARALARGEGAEVDDRWPAASFVDDVVNGRNLYRANIGPKLRWGSEPRTEVPVQLLVALRDRYVPPSLLQGLEHASPRTRRHELAAGHWALRTHPDQVASRIAELVDRFDAEPGAQEQS